MTKFNFSTVEPRYQSTAGMFGAAFLVTGVWSGLVLSYLMPLAVEYLGWIDCRLLVLRQRRSNAYFLEWVTNWKQWSMDSERRDSQTAADACRRTKCREKILRKKMYTSKWVHVRNCDASFFQMIFLWKLFYYLDISSQYLRELFFLCSVIAPHRFLKPPAVLCFEAAKLFFWIVFYVLLR